MNNTIGLSSRNGQDIYNIPVWITSRDHLDLHKSLVSFISYPLPIQLNSQDQSNNREMAKTTLPRFCLMNARSLVQKIDELAVFLSVNKIDVAAVTETWFNDDIEEELISIDGYVISCKDRQQGRGGGVCIYLSEHLHLKRRTDLECLDMECMWLWLCPTRLPRPLTGIVVGVVYSPPDRSV